ncbi:alpha/beta-hydrolase [Microthyrium microscopicum]|uniref:Alpha/beta-hydrolase n=1 Tax=Microthyrium microscopicum TaxID=703497 RepID=A0A6A6UFU3_9PEZI|nr:alpha/beta-hydrolase [Microthyrium microscopicum]
MPINTIGIVASVSPTVVGTCVSHYTNRKPRKHKPTAHISYDLGLNVVRHFIKYMAKHTVEDVQDFTAQWIPAPTWVKLEPVSISQNFSDTAAKHLIAQLGSKGVAEVGGVNWWQWRKKQAPLKAEWIEMRKDHQARGSNKSTRILFYIHGGAYYFGSVDEHRYQIQRHARKLKARAFAPRYRLAPQFPFPCGLHDCLTAYLHLLSEYDPSTILFAGDSAGGGMAASLLVLLRDQGLPLPAGAMLLSPWVDLTHSFPSILGDGKLDYIPTQGFIHMPSISWPPPRLAPEKGFNERPIRSETEPPMVSDNGIDIYTPGPDYTLDGSKPDEPKLELSVPAETKNSSEAPETSVAATGASSDRSDGTTTEHVTSSPTNPPTTTSGVLSNGTSRPPSTTTPDPSTPPARPNWIPSHIPSHQATPRVSVDGTETYILEQIQLYAPNFQLFNPLVSPALSPSLGGLCPLLIQVGSGELLSDEQVYFAHKAANPQAFPSNDEIMDRWDPDRESLNKWGPTNVQLQVWDDLCHVPHTLAWTRPAKYMYRSVAQFGAWALARAQKTTIDIDDDDSGSDSEEGSERWVDASRSPVGSIVVPREAQLDGGEGGLSTLANADETTLKAQAIDQGTEPAVPERTSSNQANGSASTPSTELVDSITTDSQATASPANNNTSTLPSINEPTGTIGKAGDALPPFEEHMIRQRVDRHGSVYPMGPPSLFFSLRLKTNTIGIVKEPAVHRWLERQKKWEKKCSRKRAAADAKRSKIESAGLPVGMDGETPPPTALVRRWVGEQKAPGRRKRGMDELKKRKMGVGLKWWSGWGSKHDEETIANQTVNDRRTTSSPLPPTTGHQRKASMAERRKSVVDEGQADHRAIRSGPNSPTPTSVRDQRPRSPSSNLLEVPMLDITGRAAGTAGSSSKFREVLEPQINTKQNGSPAPVVDKGKGPVAKTEEAPTVIDKGKGNAASINTAREGQTGARAVRPASERFYSAAEYPT